MSHWAKGMGVWILGFLTFLAGLNALNATVRWALKGRDWVFQPYLIEGFISQMQVATYFWTSIIAMLFFLGLTSIIAYSKPPPDSAILNRIVGMEEELTTNRGILESTQIGLYRRLEDNEKAREELFNKVSATLRDVAEKTVGTLEKQEKEIQKVREDLSSIIKADLADARKETVGMLEKQGEAMQKVLLSAIETNVSAIKEEMLGMLEKQMAELATLGTRLKRLEREFLPKPSLKSKAAEKKSGVSAQI